MWRVGCVGLDEVMRSVERVRASINRWRQTPFVRLRFLERRRGSSTHLNGALEVGVGQAIDPRRCVRCGVLNAAALTLARFRRALAGRGPVPPRPLVHRVVSDSGVAPRIIAPLIARRR